MNSQLASQQRHLSQSWHGICQFYGYYVFLVRAQNLWQSRTYFFSSSENAIELLLLYLVFTGVSFIFCTKSNSNHMIFYTRNTYCKHKNTFAVLTSIAEESSLYVLMYLFGILFRAHMSKVFKKLLIFKTGRRIISPSHSALYLSSRT